MKTKDALKHDIRANSAIGKDELSTHVKGSQDGRTTAQDIIFTKGKIGLNKKSKSTKQRQVFFDKFVHMKVWKDSMAGKNEDRVMEIMKHWGYAESKDYARQFPIGDKYVADFAFIEERVVIEVDGSNHNSRLQQIKDAKRDRYLWRNGWVVIRVTDLQLEGHKSFYKYLVRDVVEDRREKPFKMYDDFIY